MASSSSSSLSLSSSLSRSWEHDVFPSFHGPDVRKHFLSHILKEFIRKGISTFIDNNIKKGESIGPELKRAIKGSKIAIVLLTQNYASSSWCLDELVEIMNKVLGQTVITIFYEVDPTDVKKQTGDFGKVFRKTCLGKTKEKIQTWRKALEAVATIAGYHSRNWDDESDMVEKIAADILKMLNHFAPSHDLDLLIGMRAHMESIQLLLRLDLDEVRMIGIWGPPGIGKSTIARYLFNQLSNSFPLSAIMANIRGSYPRPCLDEGNAQLQLQNQMLSQMINHKDIMITHLGVAQERLKDRKVLLVLDDVDRLPQLYALAGATQWFGPGSRIIITTEDRSVLNAHGMINDIYKVPYPSFYEAFQMFCMYAFGQKFPKDGFGEFAHEVVYLAGYLPLGLKVMGSHFKGLKSKQEWLMELPRVRASLDKNIESILRFSYDALIDEDKDIFIHIACFFNFEMIEKVVGHLVKRCPNVRRGLDVLVEKSLISMNDYGMIEIHKLLAQLGKEIVRKQSEQKRQFLYDNDIRELLLTDPTTMTSVIGIDSTYEMSWANISERAFQGMSKLQFLRLCTDRCDHIASFSGLIKYISPKLQLLNWMHSPMTCLPFSINLENLVQINMACSKLEKLWEGIKLLQNLKWVDLSSCVNLKELPNLSTATNLQTLNLSGCSSLKKLPFSIGHAYNLQELNLSRCIKLESLPQLPDSISDLDAETCVSLERLDCSFRNPNICLNFLNCFKLNQEARDLIIQTSTRNVLVLPGGEVPAFFTYRASGSFVTLELNEKPLHRSTKFKACIVLVNRGENEDDDSEWLTVECTITSKQNALTSWRSYGHILDTVLEHLYVFDLEAEFGSKAEEVTSTELVFEFELGNYSDPWKIKECGVLQLLELKIDEDSESFSYRDEDSDEERFSQMGWGSSKRSRLV